MPYLNKLPDGKIALDAAWFRKVRDRIEENAPIPGDYILIDETEDGCAISLDAQIIEITVCKNGKPDTIKVFSPSPVAPSEG